MIPIATGTGIKAVVQRIVPRTREHGAYAVAKNHTLKGSVTFSIRATVWQEKSKPKSGDSVYLDDVRENESGWRAYIARFWKPSDEQEQLPEQPTKSVKDSR